MWVAVQTVDEDDVDKTPTDRGIDLGEAETTDLRSGRGCLESGKLVRVERLNIWQTEKRQLTIMAM